MCSPRSFCFVATTQHNQPSGSVNDPLELIKKKRRTDSGKMGHMPKYARPAHSESVEAAIEAFGNRVRVAILGALRQHGRATRGELAARIGSAEKTVQTHLRTLEGLGLVSSDPPPESRKSGQRVRYSANAPEIDTCLATLVSAVQGRTD